MCEIIFKEGINSSVELFHDGQIGGLAADIEDQVEEDHRNP